MKKLMLLSVAAAFLATSAFAQAPKEPDKMKKDHTEWEKKMKDELKLTDEQTSKYEALSTEYKGKIEAIMQDASLSKEVQKEKKMALKKEKEAKFLELLTTEQQAKYKELIEKKKKETEAASKPGGS